jgi:hypothetical protein
MELLCGYDNTHYYQQLAVEGLSDLYVFKLEFHSVGGKFSPFPCPFCSLSPILLDSWTGDGCVLTTEKYFCYPETANLTLEEIDWLFYEGKAVRRSRRVAKEGWGPGEGMARVRNSPTMLEEGRLENEREKMDGVEQVEGKAE